MHWPPGEVFVSCEEQGTFGSSSTWAHAQHLRQRRALAIHPAHEAFHRVGQVQHKVWLAVNDLAWLAVGERSRTGGVRINHAVVRAVGVFGKAIGVVVSLPAPINQVTEFITLAGGQVDSCPPNPIAIESGG